MSHLYPLIVFAVVCSITPGPNNILVMTSGLNFGIIRSLPMLCGICIGFATMLIVIGFGFGQIFKVSPELAQILKAGGVLYVLYLAWLISYSNRISQEQAQSKPFSFSQAALFQWINGKAWVVATSAITTYTSSDTNLEIQIIILVITFLFVSFPCVGVWLFFGTMLRKCLDDQKKRQWFNFIMSGLLVLSIVPVIYQIIKELS